MRNEISEPNQSSKNESVESSVVPPDYRFDAEYNEQKLVRNEVKEGMIVFDVGAHLGEYTKLFSLLAGSKGTVYSFEPTPGSFEKLSSSIQELNCSNVTLINKAVYSENSKVVLNEFPEKYSAWNSLGRPKMRNPEDLKNFVGIVDSVEVDAVTLDSFCQQHNIRRIDYLKIDVEGIEIEALRGASRLLENKVIQRLQFEISKKMLEGLDVNSKAVFDFLKSKGYECHRICPEGMIGDIVADSDSMFENFIAYPSKTIVGKSDACYNPGLGVIILGHTRPALLRNNLESLRRQGKTSGVHVWLDGDAGRPVLKEKVQQCRELVSKEFPWANLTTTYGNIGIEKLMIDGLGFMSEHYDKIVVLEDDCFPTASAIAEFDSALDEIKNRHDIYSVYGHHFLTASEGETITRFQGWGWATTRDKLLSLLPEIKKRFAMSEPDYLDWVGSNLTPEVVKRLDVTPGRNCVPVIASHFCWDGCTCLLTAMKGLSHKKTAKRVVYNCGLGSDSMHFVVNERFLQAPFNMIHPKDAWNYYDDLPRHPKQQIPAPNTAISMPLIVTNEKQSPSVQMIVEGILFKNVQRTKYQNNSVGFSDNYVLKIEHEKHPRKLRNLSEEIEVIKYLNSKGCISCPKLISDGTLKNGERYYIQQRITNDRPFNAADMIFSMLEQKNFGVCQGDFRKDNLLFNSNGICYIIDYDQALMDDKFRSMGNLEFVEWHARYMEERWREFNLTDFYKWGGYNKQEIYALFNNTGSFNLANTTIFKEQITTNNKSGIYHTLKTDKIYIEGVRDLNPRLNALKSIEFKKGEKVLDIGCNMGLLGHYLHDKGCIVTGFDMDPKIVIGAKMAANILGKDITFVHQDMDEKKIKDNYDTICLFSVIHHVKNFDEVTANITRQCRRIILEVALKEKGSKPIEGKWTKTSGWEFTTVDNLVRYLEGVFHGFKLHKYCGSVDRDRHIITFVKQPAKAGVWEKTATPVKGTASSMNSNVVEKESSLIDSSQSQYLVSAIVSTYNSEQFIRGCMEDLENQTIADKLEIIVIDSGSKQNEGAIVKEFQQRYKNIKYITTEREGIYSAWNRGIKASSGKYITNANTDDRHRRDALEIMARTLDENPDVALVYARHNGVQEINGSRVFRYQSETKPFTYERLLAGGCNVGPQPMWRRGLHDACGFFDEGMISSSDVEYWLRIAQQHQLLFIDDTLGEFLENPESVCHEGGASASLLETIFINVCYHQALRRNIVIGKEGLTNSQHDFIKDWFVTRLIRRKFAEKFGLPQKPLVTAISKTERHVSSHAISVVTYSDENPDNLKITLGKLAESRQTNFEVVLVGTQKPSILLQTSSELMCDVTAVQMSEDWGPVYARNIGAQYAKGRILVFVDSGVCPDEGWLDKIKAIMDSSNVQAIRGRIRTSDNPCVPKYFDLGDKTLPCVFETPFFSAVRRDMFENISGFETCMFIYEGADLALKIYRKRDDFSAVMYSPEISATVFPDLYQQVNYDTLNIAAKKLGYRFHDFNIYHAIVTSSYPSQANEFHIGSMTLVQMALTLQDRNPSSAVTLARRAVEMEPLNFKACAVLGTIYTNKGFTAEAIVPLERALTLLHDDIELLFNQSGPIVQQNLIIYSSCYADVATQLAQCFASQGKMSKVKTVYSHLLNFKQLVLNESLKQSLAGMLKKLEGVKAEPIEDGLEGVPKEAFRQKQFEKSVCDAPVAVTPKTVENVPSTWNTASSDMTYELVREKLSQVEGLLESEDERFLFEAAQSLPDDATIVEIGSFKGRSTCFLAYACIGTRRKIYAIDINFKNEKFLAKWKENIEGNGLGNYVIPIPGNSGEVAHQWDKPIDFIFIDGSHYYRPVLSDFIGFFPWVKDNGVVAFHDVASVPSCTGPARVWQENARQFLYDTGLCGQIAFGRKIPADTSVDKIKPDSPESISKYHIQDHAFASRRPLNIVNFNPLAKCNPALPVGANAHKILIIHTGSAGDLVLFTSMLDLYRKKYPDSHIAVCVEENVSDIVLPCPYIDEVVTYNANVARNDFEYLKRFSSRIRERKFDIAINSVYSRGEIGDFITLNCGAKRTVGFENTEGDLDPQIRNSNNPLFTTLVKVYERGMLESQKYKFLAHSLGMITPRIYISTLWVTSQDAAYTDNLYKTLGIDNPIVMQPFTCDAAIQWHVDKWAELISQYKNYPIIITGRMEDREKCDQMLRNLRQQNVYNLCGQLTIRQTAALLHKARLCVTCESDAVQLACAVDCPNVVVAGGGQLGRYMPYSRMTTAVYMPVKCCNCNWICSLPERYCITKLKVEIVCKAVDEYLYGFAREHLTLLPQVEQAADLAPQMVVYRIEEAHPAINLYARGLQLLQSNDPEGAKYVLQEAESRLRPFMAFGIQWKTTGESEHYHNSVTCYVDICAKLGLCYMQAGEFEKTKAIYRQLLENPAVELTGEQLYEFRKVIAKLQSEKNIKNDRSFEYIEKKEKQYLVTAIVSTYNSEEFIQGCLEDLENQTIAGKVEIIVVNSGSQQNEDAIIKEFQKRYDNIVYIKTENREGLYHAWNRAVKVASGQFLTNANTDDRHRKDALEILAGELIVNPEIALVYGDQVITDTANPTFENHHAIEIARRAEFSKERLLFGCCVGSQPMWRKSLHTEYGGFDEMLDVAADWDFWLKAAQKYNFKHVPQTLGLYYQNEQGLEHGQKIHSLYERYLVGRRYGNPYISIFRQFEAQGNPLVSIVMPAYNSANYIRQAIESVLIQNYRNFEIIVVDDGSTDSTKDIVLGLKNEPIQYFFKENGGVASARNFGVLKAHGSFVIMLDSDDMMTPDYIASHLLAFEQNQKADMVYCDDLLIDENNKPIRIISRPEYTNMNVFISDMFKNGFPVVHFKTCIRKSVFDKIGQYDERLIIGEDYDMMRRFAKEGLTMARIPGAFYLRRIAAGSLTKSSNSAKAKSHFEVIRRFTETFTEEQLFPDVCWGKLHDEQKEMLAKCKSALVYLGIGEQYLTTGSTDFAEAAFDMASEVLEECCKIDPADQRVRGLREKCLLIKETRLKSLKNRELQSI